MFYFVFIQEFLDGVVSLGKISVEFPEAYVA
jgi:hypothetical protein